MKKSDTVAVINTDFKRQYREHMNHVPAVQLPYFESKLAGFENAVQKASERHEIDPQHLRGVWESAIEEIKRSRE